MTATPTNGRTGTPKVLARYECTDGTRQLIGQRINGQVALIDTPVGNDGKVYLVERHVPSRDELDGLIADYLDLAAELGHPPAAQDWIWPES